MKRFYYFAQWWWSKQDRLDRMFLKFMAYMLTMLILSFAPMVVLNEPLKYQVSIGIMLVGFLLIPGVIFVRVAIWNPLCKLYEEYLQEQETIINALKK